MNTELRTLTDSEIDFVSGAALMIHAPKPAPNLVAINFGDIQVNTNVVGFVGGNAIITQLAGFSIL